MRGGAAQRISYRILIVSPRPKQLTVSNLFRIISAETKKHAAPDFCVIAVYREDNGGAPR
jgi:hypothetical protein